MKILR